MGEYFLWEGVWIWRVCVIQEAYWSCAVIFWFLDKWNITQPLITDVCSFPYLCFSQIELMWISSARIKDVLDITMSNKDWIDAQLCWDDLDSWYRVIYMCEVLELCTCLVLFSYYLIYWLSIFPVRYWTYKYLPIPNRSSGQTNNAIDAMDWKLVLFMWTWHYGRYLLLCIACMAI